MATFHQSQQHHTNDSLIDDIPTFDGKPELYCDWILKIQNIAAVSIQYPKELTSGKAQGTVIKYL